MVVAGVSQAEALMEQLGQAMPTLEVTLHYHVRTRTVIGPRSPTQVGGSWTAVAESPSLAIPEDKWNGQPAGHLEGPCEATAEAAVRGLILTLGERLRASADYHAKILVLAASLAEPLKR